VRPVPLFPSLRFAPAFHTRVMKLARRAAPFTLPWPLPALLAWLAAWVGFVIAVEQGVAAPVAFGGAALGAAVSALAASRRSRRLIVAGGFPLSAAVLGVAGAEGVPPWAWIVGALVLVLAYPLRAWRDAPWFPTPRHAFEGLPAKLLLPPAARVLDAGCGAGDGLLAWGEAYPGARLAGVEWSRPLAALARRRCPAARIVRGDLWAVPWGGFELVYLFQRPESMDRAWQKARAEMPAGAWFTSLEFVVPGVPPQLRWRTRGGRTLWCYRIPARSNRATGGR
jgi:hypothetical protein